MTAKHPIPDAALDDRIGIVGIAGSGKTYGAGTAVERILQRGGRVIIPDALGVWYGLRLLPDGTTPSPFNVVIFGGPHGDLPLAEQAGSLIGETIAGMAESALLDLTGLGTKASERRFMLAFLTALYRHASGEPVHVIFDEADLWAPERVLDREGDANKLLGMMETIVRRGRTKGFIPWLISQRPAVLSKNVLSQVDGLVAFKLTSTQDRKALGAWIEGQADREQGKDILDRLPAVQRGFAVVWVPARDILRVEQFPAKITFDSSRTPKRGESQAVAALKPLDLPDLKMRLARVQEAVEANDPAKLRAEIARLNAQISRLNSAVPAATQTHELEAAVRRGQEEGWRAGAAKISQDLADVLVPMRAAAKSLEDSIATLTMRGLHLDEIAAGKEKIITLWPTPAKSHVHVEIGRSPLATAQSTVIKDESGRDALTGPERRILDALGWMAQIGVHEPKETIVAFLAGYSPRGGAYRNPRGHLHQLGHIKYGPSGRLRLSETGVRLVVVFKAALTTAELHARVLAQLPGPERKLLQALLDAYPAALSNEELAAKTGYAANGGAFRNPRGRLHTLDLVCYPESGTVAARDFLFLDPDGRRMG